MRPATGRARLPPSARTTGRRRCASAPAEPTSVRHGPGGVDASQYNFEFRAADAAASPHLVLALLIHAGLAGLREALPTPPLVARDPSELSDEERQELGVRWLPRSLEEALAAAEADDEMRGWFPAALWLAYVALKRHELAAVAESTQDSVIRSYLDAY